MFDNEEIIDLIENHSECEYLDFKLEEYKSYDYDELIKDLMAFANSHNKQNKYIIVGIKKKNGKITVKSLSPMTDDAVYQNLISDNLEPSLAFNYLPFEYKNKQLGIFLIDANNHENRIFQLKKDYVKNGVIHFKKGDSRIRKGSSTSTLTLLDYKKIYSSHERKSSLIIQSYKEDETIRSLEFYNFDEKYSKIINDKDNNIRGIIEKIKSITMPITEEEQDDLVENNTNPLINPYSALSEVLNAPKIFGEKYVEDVEFEAEKVKIIKVFCEKQKHILSEDFFDIGNLKWYGKMVFSGGLPYQSHYVKGKSEEEQKYKLLEVLYEEICSYIHVNSYIENIKGISYLKLVMSNIGDLKDENIVISLNIPKNCLCEKAQLKCSDEYGSSLFAELYEKYLKMVATPEIDTYEKSVFNGVVSPMPSFYTPPIDIMGFGASSKESERQEILYKTEDILDEIYCYDCIDGKDFDVIKLEQNKLLHNSKCFFPEVLIFKNIPDEIHYEIKSKEMKNIVLGSLKVIN
ncbi:MAG: ATP-binding protein [Eubacteriaceae bacterium]|nr:ATP-binding protein [Eubacteriaceae bacterium]